MNSMWLDSKYINLVSNRLLRFKQIARNKWIARCPYCGDSQKSERKTRFYIYEKKGSLRTHCFNCGHSSGVKTLIQKLDPMLYGEYLCESIQESVSDTEAELPKATFVINKVDTFNLKKVSQLDPEHPVKKYVDKRKIPTKWHHRLYYAPRFMKFTNEQLPDKFSEEMLKHDHPRLVIPFIRNGKIHAYVGRALRKQDEPKYYSIVLDETVPKIFGLDKLDTDRRFYVVEGPIDAMFIDNSVAVGSSDLRAVDQIEKTKNAVLVFDNEPRNSAVMKTMAKAVHEGRSVCIWPDDWSYKDINEAVENGIDPGYIKQVIDSNTLSGLQAELRFGTWRKS